MSAGGAAGGDKSDFACLCQPNYAGSNRNKIFGASCPAEWEEKTITGRLCENHGRSSIS